MNSELSVDFQTLSRWFHFRPVDENGRATSELSRAVLLFFRSHTNEVFSVYELSEEFHIAVPLVQVLCRQLEQLHLLEQIPPDSRQYQIYTGNRNSQFRRRVWQQLSSDVSSYERENLADLPDQPELASLEPPEVYPRRQLQPVCRSAYPY